MDVIVCFCELLCVEGEGEWMLLCVFVFAVVLMGMCALIVVYQSGCGHYLYACGAYVQLVRESLWAMWMAPAPLMR